jgi:hypothetical protein
MIHFDRLLTAALLDGEQAYGFKVVRVVSKAYVVK